jgi:hypothetical protein
MLGSQLQYSRRLYPCQGNLPLRNTKGSRINLNLRHIHLTRLYKRCILWAR